MEEAAIAAVDAALNEVAGVDPIYMSVVENWAALMALPGPVAGRGDRDARAGRAAAADARSP
jgi:hypothetical protein